jgi:hypothetical protein
VSRRVGWTVPERLPPDLLERFQEEIRLRLDATGRQGDWVGMALAPGAILVVVLDERDAEAAVERVEQALEEAGL